MQDTTANYFKKIISPLGAAAVAALLALPSLAQAEEFVIPLGDLGGRPVIEVSLGDHGLYRMVLDTGAPGVIIGQDIGEKLGLTVIDQITISSPGGGGIQAMVYRGEPVSFGGYSINPERITGMDFSGLKQKSQQRSKPPEEGQPQEGHGPRHDTGLGEFPSGIIGFWVLKEGVVSIDYGADTLTIAPDAALDPAAPGVVELRFSKDFPFPEFEMTVGGFPVVAHVDTGSGGVFMMPTDWLEKLPLKSEAKVIGQAMLADGPREVWGAQLDGEVIIAGYVIQDPYITFMDGLPGVNVGSGFFQGGGFRIDRENDLIEIIRGEDEAA